MSTLIKHLERELRYAGLLSGTDPIEEKLVEDLRSLVALFASQNHSGGTGFQTLQLLDRIVNFKPLTPLAGAEIEWEPIDQMPGWLQNVRCTSVIKDDSGQSRDIGMKPVYVFPDGVTVTKSTDEAPIITFPYMPGFPPMIMVDSDGNPRTEV